MQGCLMNLIWEVQPGLSRAPNRKRKRHEAQVTSLSLLDCTLLISVSHILGSFSCSLSLQKFFLLVHIQGWRVATLVLAMHHFSDHVPNRARPAASSPSSMIPGKNICWHHSCCWIGFHWSKYHWYQLIVPVEGESHMEQTSCRLPQLWVLPILREEDLGAGEGALAPKYVHFIPYLSE